MAGEEEKLWQGIPRKEIPWYPTVDYDLCTGCGTCYEGCPNGVFEWDEEKGQPIVANPYNCVVYCSACAKNCPSDAIKFPSMAEINRIIRELRAKYAEAGKQ